MGFYRTQMVFTMTSIRIFGQSWPGILNSPFENSLANTRAFFRTDLGEVGTDAIFGLEANLRGPAETNGTVSGTLALWQKMESQLPEANRNWRFEMHLFRAYFDAYTTLTIRSTIAGGLKINSHSFVRCQAQTSNWKSFSG